MKIKKTKKVSNKKIIIALVLLVVVLGAAAALVYFTWQQNNPANIAETHNNSSSKTGDKKEKKKDSAKDKTNPAVTQKEDGESRAVDTQMLSGPTTTYCKTVQFNKASMKKGVWKYTVKYQSDNAEGASSENTFAIK